jgi:hypothetical protein
LRQVISIFHSIFDLVAADMFELQARKRGSKKQLRKRFQVAGLFAILVKGAKNGSAGT